MAYSTVAQVLDQALSKQILQGQWANPTDIQTRISEAEAEINSRLVQIGYSLPFSSTPPLVTQMSILYSRYACLRDLYQSQAPSVGSFGSKGSAMDKFKERYEEIMDNLRDGKAFLVDSTGAVIAKSGLDVTSSAQDVKRLMTMDSPENLSQTVDSSYLSSDVVGVTNSADTEDS